MKKNNKKKYFLFIVVIGACIGSYLLVGSFGVALDHREISINHSEGIVAIDPNNILQLLSQDLEKAFKPISDLDYPTYKESAPEIEPVLWSQSDYMKIAEAFFHVNWDDSVTNWEIDDFFYKSSCSDVDKTQFVQYADYTFHQVVKHAKGDDTRIERRIYIEPRESLLEWSETEYSPDFSGHLYYDLSQVKISAEEALQIAETNGGKDYRRTINNKCNISVYMKYANTLFNREYNWIVYYSGDFSFEINKETGEYKVLKSK